MFLSKDERVLIMITYPSNTTKSTFANEVLPSNTSNVMVSLDFLSRCRNLLDELLRNFWYKYLGYMKKKTNQETLTSCIYKLSMIICIHWKTFLIVMCQTTSNLSQNFMEFFSEWKRAKYCQLDTKNCQRDFWGTYSCDSIVDVWF